jgi:8-oxo-dGTP pyrophosphatase MutT (NUDIX family)
MTEVPIREAATVLLVRDDEVDGGIEVFLLRRTLGAVFTPGAHVFPGGAVDAADHLPGVDRFAVAAVRECFEEAGALLAHGAAGAFPDLRDAATAARFAGHRRDVYAGRRTLSDVCDEEGLTLALDALVPFSRWLTPEGAPRRFDTQFFVARAPQHQVLLHDDAELIESGWFRPQDALDRFRAGELDLILPTERSLEVLTSADSVDALLAAAV